MEWSYEFDIGYRQELSHCRVTYQCIGVLVIKLIGNYVLCKQQQSEKSEYFSCLFLLNVSLVQG
jgi:hypothetical protein